MFKELCFSVSSACEKHIVIPQTIIFMEIPMKYHNNEETQEVSQSINHYI